MSVFVDTSAIYAGLDARDPAHEPAVEAWGRLLAGDKRLLSHALVEVEAVALVQGRLGIDALAALRDELLPALEVVEIDGEERRRGLDLVVAARRRGVSLVDRISFELMRARGITRAFAFDRHFADEGFELITT